MKTLALTLVLIAGATASSLAVQESREPIVDTPPTSTVLNERTEELQVQRQELQTKLEQLQAEATTLLKENDASKKHADRLNRVLTQQQSAMMELAQVQSIVDALDNASDFRAKEMILRWAEPQPIIVAPPLPPGGFAGTSIDGKAMDALRNTLRKIKDLDSPGERDKVRKKAREQLAAIYDERLAVYARKIDEMEEKIQKMSDALAKRREAGERIIDLRLQLMEAELDGLSSPEFPVQDPFWQAIPMVEPMPPTPPMTSRQLVSPPVMIQSSAPQPPAIRQSTKVDLRTGTVEFVASEDTFFKALHVVDTSGTGDKQQTTFGSPAQRETKTLRAGNYRYLAELADGTEVSKEFEVVAGATTTIEIERRQ